MKSLEIFYGKNYKLLNSYRNLLKQWNLLSPRAVATIEASGQLPPTYLYCPSQTFGKFKFPMGNDNIFIVIQ